jgi:hypothetical protein
MGASQYEEKIRIYLVLRLFKFQHKRELECAWCSIIKNIQPIKMNGEKFTKFNTWSNMS